MRRVFILMPSSALPYAHPCIRTMLANSVEPVHLRLIADDAAEQRILAEETARYIVPGRAEIDVIDEAEVADRIASQFPGLEGLRGLHAGHPCWRKIIDPLALSEPDDEIIVADPDLFFPNRFDFEPTPADGVMMMRQGPNCLLPPDAVRMAFDQGVRLANHVDIGVAQLRAGAVDPDWLNRVVSDLVAERFHPFMHIEAIVWSAMAMRMGGRHLDPSAWRCWERGRAKRLAVAAGMPGRWTLRLEPFSELKCIHVSGPSKWWVQAGLADGSVREHGNDVCGPTEGPAYVELTRQHYEREQRVKNAFWKMVPGRAAAAS
ncbi:MAG: hypothetical protein ACE367_18275 [Acidimicrobiales bacterium]